MWSMFPHSTEIYESLENGRVQCLSSKDVFNFRQKLSNNSQGTSKYEIIFVDIHDS